MFNDNFEIRINSNPYDNVHWMRTTQSNMKHNGIEAIVNLLTTNLCYSLEYPKHCSVYEKFSVNFIN